MFELQDLLKAPLMPGDLTPWNLQKLGDYRLMVGIPTQLLVLDLIPWSNFQNVTSLVPRRIPLTYLLCNISCCVDAQRPG